MNSRSEALRKCSSAASTVNARNSLVSRVMRKSYHRGYINSLDETVTTLAQLVREDANVVEAVIGAEGPISRLRALILDYGEVLCHRPGQIEADPGAGAHGGPPSHDVAESGR